MSKIKEITKELMGKSLNSFHKKTGLTQIEKNNEMQDGILNGILSQVDDAYIEKTEQSNVIHLEGSGDGVVVLNSIEGNTITDVIRTTDTYSLKNTTKSVSSRWSTVGISCRQGKLNDKIYYKIKLKINNLTTDSTQLSIMSMRDNGGYNKNVALFKDLGIGNINEISTIRAIDSNCNDLYNSVTIGNHGELPSDCTNGVEFANFTLIDFVVVNLTELFGSGNEPTKEWCDNNIPYIEGLQSSFEDKVNTEGKYEVEILMKNKNLFDTKNIYRDNYYIDKNNGVNATHMITYEFNVRPNCNYTYSNNEGKHIYINLYKDGVFSTGFAGSIFNTDECNMVRLSVFKSSSWHQLEEGSAKTSYTPQKSNKIKVSLNEPLRAIGNIKDRLYVKDSRLVIERYCGIREYQEGDLELENTLSDMTNTIYLLDEIYYEEVTNEYGEPIILEGYENGTIYIDSVISPSTTIKYTPKMESLNTLKEISNNNTSLSIDINETIIPYMMEVDLMIMEKEMSIPSLANIRTMEVSDMTSMQKRTQDMLERLIKGKTLTEQECKTRVTTYLNAGKITDEQAEELMLVISEAYI